ncbi:hypothetical protein FJ366_01415 [Candidatus Dependentiae bacterium]|nr:hypothetical protein [Candidatus Dependentiae bacterium]
MKKTLILFLILLCGIAFGYPEHRSVSSEERIVRGGISSSDSSDVDPVVVFFRGERTVSDSSGFFSFIKKSDAEAFDVVPFRQKMMKSINGGAALESVSPLLKTKMKDDTYHLLITKNIEPVLEGANNIVGFKQIPGEPYLCFSCKAQNAANLSNDDILIKPKSIEKRNFLYEPSRTIILLLNPKRVESIEYWPFKLDHQFIQIPKVRLLPEEKIAQAKANKRKFMNQDLSAEDGEKVSVVVGGNQHRQSVKSHFKALEFEPFFESADQVVMTKRIGRNQLVEVRL